MKKLGIFNNSSKRLYVAGWGRTKNYPNSCFTNDFGPTRHTQCMFPFIYNGKKHKNCLKIPSPSSGNIRLAKLNRKKMCLAVIRKKFILKVQ